MGGATRRLLKGLTSLTLCALLLAQGLMPAGYMPASVDGGWVVMLCPDGLPAGFLAQDNGHHHHDHHHLHAGAGDAGQQAVSGAHAEADYCPIGSALDTAAVAPLFASSALPAIAPAPASAGEPRQASRQSLPPFASRAPPLG